MTVAIFSPYDDIKSDGTAEVWVMHEGPRPNECYSCSCIYEMLTPKQLFDILFSCDSCVEVDNDIFTKYCAIKV